MVWLKRAQHCILSFNEIVLESDAMPGAVQVIARGTPGFSGADLANLINIGALKSARDGLIAVRLTKNTLKHAYIPRNNRGHRMICCCHAVHTPVECHACAVGHCCKCGPASRGFVLTSLNDPVLV